MTWSPLPLPARSPSVPRFPKPPPHLLLRDHDLVLSGEICFRLLDLVLVLDFLGGNGSGSGGRGIGRRHRWILLRLLQLQQLLLVYRLFR